LNPRYRRRVQHGGRNARHREAIAALARPHPLPREGRHRARPSPIHLLLLSASAISCTRRSKNR
jgi:hypothetical protein